MSDNHKSLVELAKGVSIVFVFTFIGYILMFLFKLFAARYYSPEDFGLYILAESIVRILILIAGLGLSAGIMRYVSIYYYSKEYELLNGYKKFIFFISMISSLLFFFITFFLSEYITIFFSFPSEFNLILKIIAVGIPLRIFKQIMNQFLLAHKKIVYSRIGHDIIEKSVIFAGILIIMIFNLNIYYLIISLIMGYMFSLVYNLIIYHSKLPIIKVTTRKYSSKEWFMFSLPLLMSGIFSFIIGWSDNIIIAKLMTSSDLAIYSIAFSFAAFLTFFKISFSSIFMPLIGEAYAKKDKLKIRFLFKKSTSWIFGATLPIFLIMVVYSRQILTAFYGKEYALGYIPLIFISIGMLISVSLGLNEQIIMLHKKTKLFLIINLGVALLNIVLSIMLITYFGIIGAAIGSFISISLRSIIFLIISKRVEKLSFDLKYYMKFILAGIPSIFIAKYLFNLFSNLYFSSLISFILYFICYGFLLLLFRTFKEEDFEVFLEMEKELGINLTFIKSIIKRIIQ